MLVKKTLVLSIHHLSFDEQAKAAALESFCPVKDKSGELCGWALQNMGALEHRSWIMQVHPDAAHLDLSECSAGLQEVVRRAVLQGASYIVFDSAVETTPYIPEYRH